MRENFVKEIEYLLDRIPKEQWEDKGICGLMYDLTPWHKKSSATIQTRDDDPHDVAAWKYYWSAESNASRISQEIEWYLSARDRFIYHALLIEAAEAILSVDFSKYGQPKTVDGGCLYKPFQLQVHDLDGTFTFNYCEYVLARRLDTR